MTFQILPDYTAAPQPPRNRHLDTPPELWRDTAWLLPWMKRGQRVLDLGAHLNETLLDAAECLFPGQLLGTCEDLTRGFELERLATGLELLNVSYRRTRPDALPLPNEDFDGVLALQTPENPAVLQAQLEEIQRVLRPGGWLALQTRLPEETLEEILANAGLKLQAVLAEHEGWIRVRAVKREG